MFCKKLLGKWQICKLWYLLLNKDYKKKLLQKHYPDNHYVLWMGKFHKINVKFLGLDALNSKSLVTTFDSYRQLHGPSMLAFKAKIYGVLYKQSSSIAFDETSSYWSALKSS